MFWDKTWLPPYFSPMATPDFPPRLAIVTGAASGLGREFCLQLARAGGWRLAAVDVDEAGAAATIAEACRQGAVGGEALALDVTDADGWLTLREKLQATWPRLDLLINNAGVCMSAEAGEGDWDVWRRTFEVNYVGTLAGCQAMTPWLKQSASAAAPQRRPAIINVASIIAFLPAPAIGAYAASKAAVVALSEAMYAELRHCGVHVVVVAPGFFRTQLLSRGVFARRRHRAQAELLTRTATIDAAGVARQSLAAARQGRLYVVVGRRARWLWRLKRLAPTLLVRIIARRYRRFIADSADEDGDDG